MNKFKFSLWFIAFFVATTASAQITVTNTQTPEELVNDVLAGPGVVISNVQFNTSTPLAESIQVQAATYNATGTSFPIESGLILSTGNAEVAVGPNDETGASNGTGITTTAAFGDPDLTSIAGGATFHEVILEFDFIPNGDSLEFKYIFASEEYHNYSLSINDVFGFFISGPGFAGPYTDGAENIAIIPGTTLPVSMNNLNNGTSNTGPCVNCEYLVDNADGPDIQFNAHTVPLFARATVQCGETYHIKMAIGDQSDDILDSGVFLEANSFSSNGVQVQIGSVLGEDAIREGCDSAAVCFIRPADSDTVELTVDYVISGSATNGVDYPLTPETITFPIGVDTVKFWMAPVDDAVTEGTEDIIITYEIINSCGDTITSEATIEITDPQDYEIITENVIVGCPQDSVPITFTAPNGIPEFDVVWSSGGTEMIEWVPANTIGTTTYTINTVDLCGIPSAGTIDVTVDPVDPPTITFNQDLFTICTSESANIVSTVNGPFNEDSLTYEWTPGGASTPNLVVGPDVETWYYLEVYDGCFNVTDSVKINIGAVDITDIDVITATDCPGQPDAVPGSILVMPDISSWTYELIGYAGPQDNGTFNDLSGGIDYILKVTDDSGCITDTLVSVPLGENAVVATWDMDRLTPVSCDGDSDGEARVYAIGGGITPPYDVTWTNISGLFDTDNVGVDGESEQTTLDGGDWVVTVTDQEGCAWSQSFVIEEPDVLTMTLNPNEPTCFAGNDGSITIFTEGGNGGEIYSSIYPDGSTNNLSTLNSLVTGAYSITVTDSKGCTVSQDYDLGQPEELAATLTVNQPLCYGIESGYVLVDTVINYNGDFDNIDYQWEPESLISGGGDGLNFANKLGPGTYTVTINDETGCPKVYDFTIEYPEPILVVLEADSAFCRVNADQVGNGKIEANPSGGVQPLVYEWKYLETGEVHSPTTWGGRDYGNYEFTAIDANGCVVKDTIRVDTLNPQASFTIDSDQLNSDLQGTADVSVIFTNTSENVENPNNPLSQPTFFWTLDSLSTDPWQFTDDYNEQFDTTYKARGESYTIDVCLTAINDNTCTSTHCEKITIFEPVTFTNVNIFSPNGDGVNDEFSFKFKSASISEFQCVIVNRWGVVVAELNDISQSWNGTNKGGTPLPDGVYYYTYTAKTDNGETLKEQSSLTIVGTGLNQ